MSPVPTQRNSLRLIVTYAGIEGDSVLLEEMYRRGLAGNPVPGLEDIDKNFSPLDACRR